MLRRYSARSCCSSGEENALCHPDDRYLGDDITIHQFAHTMHLQGVTLVFPAFNSELSNLYSAAKSGKYWGSGHYAMTNYIDYFAEGVQRYFDANYNDRNAPTTREQLKTKVPELFGLVQIQNLRLKKKVWTKAEH